MNKDILKDINTKVATKEKMYTLVSIKANVFKKSKGVIQRKKQSKHNMIQRLIII